VADLIPSLQECVGKPVTSLIPFVFALHPQIEAVHVVAYRPAPNLGERIEHERGVLKETSECAALLHERYGVGFWDSVLSMALHKGELGAQFVRLAMMHDAAPDEREFRLTRREWDDGKFDAIDEFLPDGYGVAISSRLELSGQGEAHLPMLDFRCPHSDAAVALLRGLFQELKQERGVLVKSRRSYHYYGLNIVSKAGLTEFLARALLASPVVDSRYIGHRMLDGACRLRISAAQGKGQIPVVEEILIASGD
jgi:hypothetical protein